MSEICGRYKNVFNSQQASTDQARNRGNCMER